jgi:glycerol-3-phosphate dehydrogenase
MSAVRDAYLAEIQQKREAVKKIVARKFPYPCEVRGSMDSQETLVITLFCVPAQKHDEVLDQLDELVEDMQSILEYLMVLSQVKTPEVTQRYFPEYYLENTEKSGTR